MSQVNVSQIERAEDTQLSTISRYVQGLGGHLELLARFSGEQTVTLALPATDPFSPGHVSGSWQPVARPAGPPWCRFEVTINDDRAGYVTVHVVALNTDGGLDAARKTIAQQLNLLARSLGHDELVAQLTRPDGVTIEAEPVPEL